jgi:hypothetical protein
MIRLDKEYPFASVAKTLKYLASSYQSITSAGAFTEESHTNTFLHDRSGAQEPNQVANANVAPFSDCVIRICQGVQAGQRFIIWDDLVNILRQAGIAQPLLFCKPLLVWFLRRLSMHNILIDRSIDEFVCDRNKRHKEMIEGQMSNENVGKPVLLARCLDATDVDVFCDVLTWFLSAFYNSNSHEETHISRIIYGLQYVQNGHLLTNETLAAYQTWKEEYKHAPNGQHKLKADLFALYDYITVQQKTALSQYAVRNSGDTSTISLPVAMVNKRASTLYPPMHHTSKLPPLLPRVMRTHNVYMLPQGVTTPQKAICPSHVIGAATCGSIKDVNDGSESAMDVASWLIALRGSREQKATPV